MFHSKKTIFSIFGRDKITLNNNKRHDYVNRNGIDYNMHAHYYGVF
jgi:hypothetical protein